LLAAPQSYRLLLRVVFAVNGQIFATSLTFVQLLAARYADLVGAAGGHTSTILAAANGHEMHVTGALFAQHVHSPEMLGILVREKTA
jgi:hypothetical protein